MSSMIMAVFDFDRKYCIRLSEYLRNNVKLSFSIQAFTQTDELINFFDQQKISLLVISESGAKELSKMKSRILVENIIVLLESEEILEEGILGEGGEIRCISKYLPAKRIVDEVLDICRDRADDFKGLGIKAKDSPCRVIGFFTPLSKSGQTSLAIKMGEELSEKGKTILLSFESFSYITGMFQNEVEEDITDLIYYADCERDKFCIYLEKIRQSRNNLDYIAPPQTAMQIKEIGAGTLRELLTLLSRDAGYEYILLDLKEYPSDFFEILGMCDVVYTAVREGKKDSYRVLRYNTALAENGYEEVIAKTVKCSIPDIKDRSCYGRYVRNLIKEGREVANLGE